jgi:radical SAM superfamily enzyme YgiQ (UPF0313 family)
MKILFLYPEIPDTFWSFKHALKFVSKKAAFPPLGLLTVAAMMPGAWEKRLVDMNVRRLKDSDILWADYVCISAMHVQKDSVVNVIARCKALGARIIAGGPYFTTSPDLFDDVDHLVLGEGELVLPELVSDLTSGTARRIYAPRPGPELSLTPVPQWDLINPRDYESMLVQFSRGCPFDCEFCDIVILNGRRQRTKSPSQFISEIDSLYRSGWRGSIFVVDDNFIGAKHRVKAMLRELGVWMARHGRPFHFLTEASINLAEDSELMTLMADAGFNKVFVGIETPNVECLKETNKQQNLKKDLLQAVKTIQHNGMEVMAGFILGFDHDPETIFENQIDFIQSSGITMAMVGLLTALPGTKLWKRLSSEGRLIGESSGNNTAVTLNFIPKMDVRKLVEGYRRVVETVYSPEDYYRRCVTFLKDYRQKTVSKINFSGIMALFRSTWRMGIKNDEGFRPWFWKLLIKSLMINPRTFGEAVRLMIVGIHFRKSLCAAVGLIPDDYPSGGRPLGLEGLHPTLQAPGKDAGGQEDLLPG